jgi:hypothetical protein
VPCTGASRSDGLLRALSMQVNPAPVALAIGKCAEKDPHASRVQL